MEFGAGCLDKLPELIQKLGASKPMLVTDPGVKQAGLLEKVLPVLSQKMNVGGVIICETPSDITLPEEAGEFTKRREYRYGRVVLNLYRHRSIED